MPNKQNMEALALANRIRLARADVKRQLKREEITLSEAFERECVQTMTIQALLESVRLWRTTRSLKLLDNLQISPERSVASITTRQRKLIVKAIDNHTCEV